MSVDIDLTGQRLLVVGGSSGIGRSTALAAAEHLPLMISTQKAFGPVPGTFSTSGAFADYGTLITEHRTTSAIPSPFGVVTHLVLLFEGQQGTFTLRTQIIETVTNDPNIFADDGVWVIISGWMSQSGVIRFRTSPRLSSNS